MRGAGIHLSAQTEVGEGVAGSVDCLGKRTYPQVVCPIRDALLNSTGFGGEQTRVLAPDECLFVGLFFSHVGRWLVFFFLVANR